MAQWLMVIIFRVSFFWDWVNRCRCLQGLGVWVFWLYLQHSDPLISKISKPYFRLYWRRDHRFLLPCQSLIPMSLKLAALYMSMFAEFFKQMQGDRSCLIFRDIHMECMKEMLFYCYSGRSPQLSTMAFDLLAISDRFQLVGLKDMCGQVLQMGLTADNVCKK